MRAPGVDEERQPELPEGVLAEDLPARGQSLAGERDRLRIVALGGVPVLLGVQDLLARTRRGLEAAADGLREVEIAGPVLQEGLAAHVGADEGLPEVRRGFLEHLGAHGGEVRHRREVERLDALHRPTVHHRRPGALDDGVVGPLGVGVPLDVRQLVVDVEELVVECVCQLVGQDDARHVAFEAFHQVEGLASGVIETTDLRFHELEHLLEVVVVRREQAEELGDLLVGRDLGGRLGGVDARLHVVAKGLAVGDGDVHRSAEALAAQLLHLDLDLGGDAP